MPIDISSECLRSILIAGGMSETTSLSVKIQDINDDLYAIVCKLGFKDSRVCYLKFSNPDASQSKFNLKFHTAANDQPASVHAEKRRKKIRKMVQILVTINRSSIFQRPLYLNLDDQPMTLQRKRQVAGVLIEYKIPSEIKKAPIPKRLTGMVATLWEEIPRQNLSSCFSNGKSHHPLTIKRVSAGYAELQNYSSGYLEKDIKRKLVNGKGSSGAITE